MFFKIRKFIAENTGDNNEWLRSLNKRNTRSYFKNDDAYYLDLKRTFSEYFRNYLDGIERSLVENGEITSIQKYLKETSYYGEGFCDRTSDESKLHLDAMSENAVSLIAFCNCFEIEPNFLKFYTFSLSPKWYLDYIFERERVGAFFIAGIILRYHSWLGGLENNKIAEKVFLACSDPKEHAHHCIDAVGDFLYPDETLKYNDAVLNGKPGYKIVYKFPNTNLALRIGLKI